MEVHHDCVRRSVGEVVKETPQARVGREKGVGGDEVLVGTATVGSPNVEEVVGRGWVKLEELGRECHGGSTVSPSSVSGKKQHLEGRFGCSFGWVEVEGGRES